MFAACTSPGNSGPASRPEWEIIRPAALPAILILKDNNACVLLGWNEPFGALDAITRVSMQLLLFQMLRAHPCTVVLVTHDVEEAVVLSNRILVLRDGQVAKDFELQGAIPRDRSLAHLAVLKAQLINELLAAEESAEHC